MAERKCFYDPSCEDLAAIFLETTKIGTAETKGLAQHIQNAVEEWFAAREADQLVNERKDG